MCNMGSCKYTYFVMWKDLMTHVILYMYLYILHMTMLYHFFLGYHHKNQFSDTFLLSRNNIVLSLSYIWRYFSICSGFQALTSNHFSIISRRLYARFRGNLARIFLHLHLSALILVPWNSKGDLFIKELERTRVMRFFVTVKHSWISE